MSPLRGALAIGELASCGPAACAALDRQLTSLPAQRAAGLSCSRCASSAAKQHACSPDMIRACRWLVAWPNVFVRSQADSRQTLDDMG